MTIVYRKADDPISDQSDRYNRPIVYRKADDPISDQSDAVQMPTGRTSSRAWDVRTEQADAEPQRLKIVYVKSGEQADAEPQRLKIVYVKSGEQADAEPQQRMPTPRASSHAWEAVSQTKSTSEGVVVVAPDPELPF